MEKKNGKKGEAQTAKKPEAKITPEQGYKAAQQVVKGIEYLLENTGGFKPKGLTYARTLVSEWGKQLLVQASAGKAIDELKAKQKLELEAARAKFVEEAAKKISG